MSLCIDSTACKAYVSIAGSVPSSSVEGQLQFKYGDASYGVFCDFRRISSDFNQNDSRGTFRSSLQALTDTISRVSLPIFINASRALFIGIPDAIGGDSSHFKAYAFYVIRDFQEIFGRILSLFSCSAQMGSYHIEESLFQKQCYGIVLNPRTFAENLAQQEFIADYKSEVERLRQEYPAYDDFEAQIETAVLHAVESKHLDTAFAYSQELTVGTWTRRRLVEKIVYQLCINDKKDRAFEILKQEAITDKEGKDELYTGVASQLFNVHEPDFVTAHQMLEHVFIEAKDPIYIDLAEKCLTPPSNPEKALEFLQMVSDTPAQEPFSEYFRSQSISYKNKKEHLLAQTALIYFLSLKLDECICVLKGISWDSARIIFEDLYETVRKDQSIGEKWSAAVTKAEWINDRLI